jgi:transposase-like protein
MSAERRKFTRKYKIEVVRAYLQRGPTETQATIGERFKLGKSAVSSWINRYAKEAGRGLALPPPASDRRKVAPTRAPPPAPPAPPPRPAAEQQRALFALANVISAIEPLGAAERRMVVGAVLGLLPP